VDRLALEQQGFFLEVNCLPTHPAASPTKT